MSLATNTDFIHNIDLEDILLSQKILSRDDYRNAEQQAKRDGLTIEAYLHKSGLVPHLSLQVAVAVATGQHVRLVHKDAPHIEGMIGHKLSSKNGYEQIDNYNGFNAISTAAGHVAIGNKKASQIIDNIVVTSRDFRHVFIKKYHSQLSNQAANLLAEKAPNLTAKFGLYCRQKLILITLLFSILLVFSHWPILGFYYLSFALSILFLTASAIKFYSIFLPTESNEALSEAGLALKVDELPTYSILVPLYKEATVIKRLTENLLNLDYCKTTLIMIL